MTRASTEMTGAVGETVVRRRFVVRGIVQGVGFRPFVHRVASRLGLAGSAYNFTGGVEIEVEGPPSAVLAFGAALVNERPAIAVVDDVVTEDLAPTGQTDFVIVPSREQPGGQVFISTDLALCGDCRRELLDPADRRYHYPFINCTNCGPRYTITARVPYDRPNTSMKPFLMCQRCAGEYQDIADRRYHAQPVACPHCGPVVEFAAAAGMTCRGGDALEMARTWLGNGRILAIKGLGGFHLACDAGNEEAVQALRRRKGREQKPLAVMVRDLGCAEQMAQLTPSDRHLLQSPQMPIVLAPKRLPERLASSVAPASSDYGVMLPYTPLHEMLFLDSPLRALVMTSGNLSDEPLCTDNQEALQRLSAVADAFLWHDRDILVGCDDSVVRTTRCGPIMIRRARGYAPCPTRLAHSVRPVLAVGGHLKDTVCFTAGTGAVLSQHLGDLENMATLCHFERLIEHLQAVLQVEPQALACDLHPDYLSTRWATETAERLGLPLIGVQHHHAHIAACLADNGVSGPVVGLACDGTGYGEDGAIWGCEVLEADLNGFRRLGHLREVPLPGGEAAVREPWRMAAAYLHEAYGPEALDTVPARLTQIGASQWGLLRQMLQRRLNCPLAASAGRLFDAVSALLGLCLQAGFEGQAAITCEAAAEPTHSHYPYAIHSEDGNLLLDPLPTVRAVVDDLARGVTVPQIAGCFHETFALMLAEAAQAGCDATGHDTVALSGGTFQNRLLLERLHELLIARGLHVLCHQAVPPNDGGLALGQAVVADAQLRAD